jgi:hypothetical protein
LIGVVSAIQLVDLRLELLVLLAKLDVGFVRGAAAPGRHQSRQNRKGDERAVMV